MVNLSSTRSHDFVIILGPMEALVRPTTENGRAFLHERFANWPRGIGQAIALAHNALNDVVDAITRQGLRIEVL